MSGHHFLGYLQNHDQIGNRAKGERSSHMMNTGRLKIGAAIMLTSPFVPMLFQGEEWGASTPFIFFTNHKEPELARGVTEGRCKEFVAFGWDPKEVPDPQAPETFQRSKLKWDEIPNPPHAELLEWHRKLIQLRRAEPALSDGRRDLLQTRHDEEARWLVVERGPISIVYNLAADPQPIALRPGNHRLLMASDSAAALARDTVKLPPDSVVIIKTAEESRSSAG